MARKNQPEQESTCAYCQYATVLQQLDLCICKKFGAVRPDDQCKRFRLDLLKVDPHPPLLLTPSQLHMPEHM